MAEFVYTLCAATAIACAVLLLRAYLRERSRLLFWSSLCFFGLALNNLLLLVELYVFPENELVLLRTCIALAAMGALLFGLVWHRR